ncbi:hypothetical protein ES703_56118 [subsurface metagenome]
MMGSYADEYGFISLSEEAVNGQFLTDRGISLYLYSQTFYLFNLIRKYVFRQTILRDTYIKHPSSYRESLKDSNLVSLST